MAQTRELSDEFRIPGRPGLPPRTNILPPEEIAARNHRRAHRTVFVGPLRPRGILVQPKIEAHALMVSIPPGYRRRLNLRNLPLQDRHRKTRIEMSSRTLSSMLRVWD